MYKSANTNEMNLIKNSNTTITCTKTDCDVENGTKPEKNYRVKDDRWYCMKCEVFCNSDSQYQVHMMSTKHKMALCEVKESECITNTNGSTVVVTNKIEEEKSVAIDIKENHIARTCHVDATKYFIPAELKVGKYQKFGFYCGLCKVYMTGQIQLIMHVKGAKHQYLSPNEIPGYSPTKQYDPNKGRRRFFQRSNNKQMGQTQCSNNSQNGQFNEQFGIQHQCPPVYQSQQQQQQQQQQHSFYVHPGTCVTPPSQHTLYQYATPTPQHYSHATMKRDASVQIGSDQLLRQFDSRYSFYQQPLTSFYPTQIFNNGFYSSTSTPSPLPPTPPISSEINNNYIKHQSSFNDSNRQLAVNYKNFSNTILPALHNNQLNSGFYNSNAIQRKSVSSPWKNTAELAEDLDLRSKKKS